MEARSFDGHRVEETLARLAGTFAVDPNDADLLIADRTVVAIVVARVTGETSKIMRRTGVVRRTNVLDVHQFAVVREPELQQLLIEHMPQLEGEHVTPPEAWDHTPAPEPEESEWMPPAVSLPVQEPEQPLFKSAPPAESVVGDDDDEVFAPSGTGGQRVPVGGARRNDPALARFLNGLEP